MGRLSNPAARVTSYMELDGAGSARHRGKMVIDAFSSIWLIVSMLIPKYTIKQVCSRTCESPNPSKLWPMSYSSRFLAGGRFQRSCICTYVTPFAHSPVADLFTSVQRALLSLFKLHRQRHPVPCRFISPPSFNRQLGHFQCFPVENSAAVKISPFVPLHAPLGYILRKRGRGVPGRVRFPWAACPCRGVRLAHRFCAGRCGRGRCTSLSVKPSAFHVSFALLGLLP